MVVVDINGCGLDLSGRIVSSIVSPRLLPLTPGHNSFRTACACCSCRDDERLWLAVQTVHGLVAGVPSPTITW